eukprot:jgi/Mesvir1/1689/Mv21150-RA.1
MKKGVAASRALTWLLALTVLLVDRTPKTAGNLSAPFFLATSVLAGVVACMAAIVSLFRVNAALSIVAVATALETYAFGWSCKFLQLWDQDVGLGTPRTPHAMYKTLVAFAFITAFFTWLLFLAIGLLGGAAAAKELYDRRGPSGEEHRAAAPARAGAMPSSVAVRARLGHQEREHGGSGPGYRLSDLIYADDTTLIARPEHIQTWLDCLGLEAQAVGLEISVKAEATSGDIGASSRPPLPRLS